jgi:hypothetical protein
MYICVHNIYTSHLHTPHTHAHCAMLKTQWVCLWGVKQGPGVRGERET